MAQKIRWRRPRNWPLLSSPCLFPVLIFLWSSHPSDGGGGALIKRLPNKCGWLVRTPGPLHSDYRRTSTSKPRTQHRAYRAIGVTSDTAVAELRSLQF